MNIHSVTYPHIVLTGTPYEAGKFQGEIVGAIPPLAQFFTSPNPDQGSLTPAQAETAVKFFERHCPGLNDEIQGFADALGAPLEQIAYYAFTYQQPGNCSHMIALPSQTANGHLLVGRNYEFSHTMSDMRLATTRLEGRAAHIGFSEVLFGRDDGLNEHGLCATISAGAPMAPTEPGGCTFWALVRSVLDRCTCVDEALEMIAGIPLSFNLNLMLADRSGQAASLELACSHRAVRRIGPDSPQQMLIATNHFTMPEMVPYDLGRMWNSVKRRQTIQRRLEAAAGQISVETMRGLLSDMVPEGLCGHDYTGFFGTLWSEIFDVTAGTVEVCFGAPTHNPWHTFRLDSPGGEYPVQLPDEPADLQFWKKLAPGQDE